MYYTYYTYIIYTYYGQVHQALGPADHVWQDKMAAIAKISFVLISKLLHAYHMRKHCLRI